MSTFNVLNITENRLFRYISMCLQNGINVNDPSHICGKNL